MPRIELVNRNKTNKESTYLKEYAKRVYSQFGEEGIIEKCLEIITTKNNWCVEFGAWDGIHLSNTCYFIKHKGWSAIQIEGNPEKFNELQKNFKENPSTIQVNKIVGFIKGKNTIDDILGQTSIPTDFDFISIDIDGNDWYVWESMEKYRPRLVVIEFNPLVPNDVIFIQDNDNNIHQGCSLAALIELAEQKKYELICVHHVNAYFVVQEEFSKFNILDNGADAMKVNSHGRIWCGYDGTVFNTLWKIPWTGKGKSVDPLEYQSLSLDKRVYHDAIEKKQKVTTNN